MALRPVFIPQQYGNIFVKRELVEFKWFNGFSFSQYQKSINSLHEKIKALYFIDTILEISSKSPELIGRELSAFNLKINFNNTLISVENIFQGSKVFECGGPYTELLYIEAKEAKKKVSELNKYKLIRFEFNGVVWPLEPKTAFYDWLYINALFNSHYKKDLMNFGAFTDIVFNIKRSINCQAQSAALFVALEQRNLLKDVLINPQKFLTIYNSPIQLSLFNS